MTIAQKQNQVNFGKGKESGERHQKTASLACARQMPATGQLIAGPEIHRKNGCHSRMQGHYLHFSIQSQEETPF